MKVLKRCLLLDLETAPDGTILKVEFCGDWGGAGVARTISGDEDGAL
jgi:hypothetical protein